MSVPPASNRRPSATRSFRASSGSGLVVPSRLLTEHLASEGLTERQKAAVRRVQNTFRKAIEETNEQSLTEFPNSAPGADGTDAPSLTARSIIGCYEQRSYRSGCNPLY